MSNNNVTKTPNYESESSTLILLFIRKVRHLFKKYSNDEYSKSDEKRVENLLFEAFNITITAENAHLIHYADFMREVKLREQAYNNLESATNILTHLMANKIPKKQADNFQKEYISPILTIFENNSIKSRNDVIVLYKEKYYNIKK